MRALNRSDGRDLVVLLVTLVVMNLILIGAAQLLLQFPLPIVDGWLISCVLLLIWKRKRFGPRLRAWFRRRVTPTSKTS